MSNSKITPNPDQNSPTGVYIPLGIEDCFIELDKALTTDDRTDLQGCSKLELSKYHLGLGMWIRNNWGLWRVNSPLRQQLVGLGILHADSMSSLIISAYWDYLNGRPFDILEWVFDSQLMQKMLGKDKNANQN